MTDTGDADPGAVSAPPYVLGLTGGIGMGKSTVAEFFKKAGVPVFCADAAVHEMYAAGGAAVPGIRALFPDAITEAGAVDRPKLGPHVLGVENIANMKALEAVVHPLVEEARRRFLKESMALAAPLVVYDIPLLYETNAEGSVDAVVVVSCPPDAQEARVLARPNFQKPKFDAIKAAQLPDDEKRARADFIVDTSTTVDETHECVLGIVQKLKGAKGEAAQRMLQHAA